MGDEDRQRWKDVLRGLLLLSTDVAASVNAAGICCCCCRLRDVCCSIPTNTQNTHTHTHKHTHKHTHARTHTYWSHTHTHALKHTESQHTPNPMGTSKQGAATAVCGSTSALRHRGRILHLCREASGLRALSTGVRW